MPGAAPVAAEGPLSFELLWMLGTGCEYHCPYCSYAVEDRRGFLAAMETRRPPPDWKNAWLRLRERLGEAQVLVSGGGEPASHPDFPILLTDLSELHHVGVDTNLSWRGEQLRELAGGLSPERVRFHASFHPSETTLDDFIAKLKELAGPGFRCETRWVAYPPFLDRLSGYRVRFASEGLRFSVTPFCGQWQGRRYPESYSSQERRAILGDPAGEPDAPADPVRHLMRRAADTPGGRLCRAGSSYGCIMPDGMFYRCREHAMRGMPPVGSFLDGPLPPHGEPSPCRASSCGDEFRWTLAPREADSP